VNTSVSVESTKLNFTGVLNEELGELFKDKDMVSVEVHSKRIPEYILKFFLGSLIENIAQQ